MRQLLGRAAGSVVFFVFIPGVVGGLVPWSLTGWRFVDPVPFWAPLHVAGAILTGAGALLMITAFVQFVHDGRGTPAPVAPPQNLVVKGVYRYVRNPMYVAVITVIVGQALLFGQLGLLVYAGIIAAFTFAFVRGYEEPHLAKIFGGEYEQYRRAVPGWWPRLRA